MENIIGIKHAPNLNFVILASSRLTPFRATTSRHLPRGRSPQYFYQFHYCFPFNQAYMKTCDYISGQNRFKWNPFLNRNKRPIDQTSFSIIVTWSSLKKHRFLTIINIIFFENDSQVKQLVKMPWYLPVSIGEVILIVISPLLVDWIPKIQAHQKSNDINPC